MFRVEKELCIEHPNTDKSACGDKRDAKSELKVDRQFVLKPLHPWD